MEKSFPALVILPENYEELPEAEFPVVYLLHGHSGDYRGWLKDAPHLTRLATQYGIIAVCPEGGYNSWYVDSPVDPSVRFDTYLSREVPAFVDSTYRTVNAPRGRAIAGLSMGGHGALLIASFHPDVFGAAGSMAGGLDLRPWKRNDWQIERVLGDPGRNGKNWETYSVINRLEAFRQHDVQLIIDCGDQDFFLAENRAVHQRLKDLHIPHVYTERPGAHNPAYWGTAVDYVMLFFADYFGG